MCTILNKIVEIPTSSNCRIQRTLASESVRVHCDCLKSHYSAVPKAWRDAPGAIEDANDSHSEPLGEASEPLSDHESGAEDPRAEEMTPGTELSTELRADPLSRRTRKPPSRLIEEFVIVDLVKRLSSQLPDNHHLPLRKALKNYELMYLLQFFRANHFTFQDVITQRSIIGKYILSRM